MSETILEGDCVKVLADLPDGLVRCCVTSPPYWGLRDYGTATWEGGDAGCDHVAPALGGTGRETLVGTTAAGNGTRLQQYRDTCGKCGATRIDSQLGLERTPEEYVARMVEVFGEVRRVLADDGTLWLNLGDSYAAQRGATSMPAQTVAGSVNGKSQDLDAFRGMSAGKSAHRDAAAIGLKHKDLIGIPWRVAFALQADGWYLRSDIIWAKPNPMPESVTDRPTKAHEYLFLLAKSQRYYYDAWAVSEPATHAGKVVNLGEKSLSRGQAAGAGVKASGNGTADSVTVADLRNRRTVWTVPTQPFSGAHFAVMPEALVEPCVLAGSAPGDTVLDPFAGSGTVGVVALRYGRRFIGCELNAEYCQMARRRVAGPLFAEVAP